MHLIFRGLLFTATERREDRGAHRNISQKATEIEGAYRDEGGGDRAVHDHSHRPKGVACSVAGSVGSDAEGFKAPVWTKISHGKKFDYGDDLRHKLPAR
jgi:hypothetical protein